MARRPRSPYLDRAVLLSDAVRSGGVVADLGCGAGLHLPYLPRPAVALDAASAMVELAREAAPDVPGVQGDLEALPFRRGALEGAWARASYLHVARDRLPWALMELHHVLAVGAPAHLTMMRGEGEGPFPNDDFAGRFFARWHPDELRDVLTGAGLDVVDMIADDGTRNEWLHVLVRRERTLPDVGRPRHAAAALRPQPESVRGRRRRRVRRDRATGSGPPRSRPGSSRAIATPAMRSSTTASG